MFSLVEPEQPHVLKLQSSTSSNSHIAQEPGSMLLVLAAADLQHLLSLMLGGFLPAPQALAVCRTCRALLPFRAAITVARVQGRRCFMRLMQQLSRSTFPWLSSLTCAAPAVQQHLTMGPAEAKLLAMHLCPPATTTTAAAAAMPPSSSSSSLTRQAAAAAAPSLLGLQSLSLLEQDLGEEGAAHLFRALASHPSLTSLAMDGTALLHGACERLAEALRGAAGGGGGGGGLRLLRVLSLRSCRLTTADMACLAPALPQSLTELHVSGNPFLAVSV